MHLHWMAELVLRTEAESAYIRILLCIFTMMDQLNNTTALNTGKKLKLIFGILIPALWVSALFFPAYSDGTPGIICLLMGWLMLFSGKLFAFGAWLSNVPFWISYFMMLFGKQNSPKIISLIFAVIALILSFGAFSVNEIMQNEGGMTATVHPSAGVFVWMIPGVLLLSWNTIVMKRS
jgi:hypothetical protein